MTIKLLAMSKEKSDGYLAAVAPYLLDREKPLAGVSDVFNAIYVYGNTLGESMFYGKGAGKLPTASAVVADVVDCAKHQGKHIICLWEEEKMHLKDFSQAQGRFFVRVKNAGEDAAEALFGNVEKIHLEEYPEEFAFITPVMSEEEFAKKQAEMAGFVTRIRIKD